MMRTAGNIMLSIVVPLSLAACGGSSSAGGISSTPPPAPAPTPTPAPTNTDVSDLRADDSFTTSAAYHRLSFDMRDGTTASSSSSRRDLTIEYDASAGSYTVSAGGDSDTFGSAEKMAVEIEGETRFRKIVGGNAKSLSLTNIGYASGLETTSVAVGHWQSSIASGHEEDVQMDLFVYGFPSPVSAVPRSGGASYAINLQGFASPTESEPLSFVGDGTMGIDFDNANFTMNAALREYYLVSGQLVSAQTFRSGGTLGSAGDFNGTFYYQDGDDPMSGTLSGNFFGPAASEVGGIFSGSGLPGTSVTGAFTGREEGPAPTDMTLADLTPGTSLNGSSANLHTLLFADPERPGQAGTDFQPRTSLHYKLADWEYWVPNGPRFAASDSKSSSTDFDVYETMADSGNISRLSIFQPSGNGEIELTYATFAKLEILYATGGTSDVADRTFIAAGLPTPRGTLDARTGTATYSGLAFGAAASHDATRNLSISGTSRFHIDFATQGYYGALQLTGTDVVDASTVDFGRFDLVPGSGFAEQRFDTGFIQDVPTDSRIDLRFYGPTGEELGGAFHIHTPDGYAIVGAALSKRD